jgi:peptide deformylase
MAEPARPDWQSPPRLNTSLRMSETEASPTETGAAAQDDAPLIPILIAPHRTLKTKARAVTPDDMDRVRDIVPRMFAAMYKAPGIGLAAPQVDVSLRFAVIDLMPKDKPQPFTMINPEVLQVSEEWATREEGCLSLPNMYADVSRPAQVRVGFYDLNGKRHEIDAEGLMSACLQHEIDHLDGVLFVDHLSILKRNMILRKLAKEQKLKA